MRTLTIVLALVVAAACGDTYVSVPVSPSTLPTVPTVAALRTTVAFRAIGTPTSVRVRYATPADGLAQIVTTLPWNGQFETSADNLFLSIEGVPLSTSILTASPFFGIQIIVNGSLFREATSSSFLLETLTVSGTWRR